MRSGPERPAGIDRDRILVVLRLLPGRHDPDAAGAHRPVEVLPTLLPVGRHLFRRNRSEDGGHPSLAARVGVGRELELVAALGLFEALREERQHLGADVAGAGAASAGMALAGDPNLLAVMDPGRDLDLERSLLDDPALAAAVGAGLLDPLARAPAGRTGLGADELAEGAPGDPLQAAGAAASLTGDRARARRGSTARAGAARDRNGERNLPLDSARSLG